MINDIQTDNAGYWLLLFVFGAIDMWLSKVGIL